MSASERSLQSSPPQDGLLPLVDRQIPHSSRLSRRQGKQRDGYRRAPVMDGFRLGSAVRRHAAPVSHIARPRHRSDCVSDLYQRRHRRVTVCRSKMCFAAPAIRQRAADPYGHYGRTTRWAAAGMVLWSLERVGLDLLRLVQGCRSANPNPTIVDRPRHPRDTITPADPSSPPFHVCAKDHEGALDGANH